MGKQRATKEIKTCRPVADGQGAKRDSWLAKPLTLVLIHELRPLSASVSLSHTPLRLSFPSTPLIELFSPGGRGVFPAWGFSASRQFPVRWYSPFKPGSLWREIFVLPSLELEHASPGPATWKVCPGCSVNGSVSQSIRLL